MSTSSCDATAADDTMQDAAALPMVSEITDLANSNDDDANVPILLPMEIFSNVLSFCPMSMLLAMRATNKQFRAFASKECQQRHEKFESRRKAALEKDPNYKAPSFSDYLWGLNKQGTVKKALELAKSVFFKVDEDGGQGPVLLADGYDEVKVETALQKDGIVFEQDAQDGPGSSKFWRIETRWEKITVAHAIREIRLFGDEYKRDVSNVLFVLVSAPPGARARIAESEVAIRQHNGGRCKWKAIQAISVESTDGFLWMFPLPMRTINDGSGSQVMLMNRVEPKVPHVPFRAACRNLIRKRKCHNADCNHTVSYNF